MNERLFLRLRLMMIFLLGIFCGITLQSCGITVQRCWLQLIGFGNSQAEINTECDGFNGNAISNTVSGEIELDDTNNYLDQAAPSMENAILPAKQPTMSPTQFEDDEKHHGKIQYIYID